MADLQPVIDALNRDFARKYHSLAQYLIDAKPYVRPGEEPLLAAIGAVAADDREEVDRLSETIQQLEGIPQLAGYNAGVADLNYLGVGYLAGVLIAELERQLADEEGALALVGDCEPARVALERLTQSTRRHLSDLRALRPDPAQNAAK